NGPDPSMKFRSVWAGRRAVAQRKSKRQKKIRAVQNYFSRRDEWTSLVHSGAAIMMPFSRAALQNAAGQASSGTLGRMPGAGPRLSLAPTLTGPFVFLRAGLP